MFVIQPHPLPAVGDAVLTVYLESLPADPAPGVRYRQLPPARLSPEEADLARRAAALAAVVAHRIDWGAAGGRLFDAISAEEGAPAGSIPVCIARPAYHGRLAWLSPDGLLYPASGAGVGWTGHVLWFPETEDPEGLRLLQSYPRNPVERPVGAFIADQREA